MSARPKRAMGEICSKLGGAVGPGPRAWSPETLKEALKALRYSMDNVSATLSPPMPIPPKPDGGLVETLNDWFAFDIHTVPYDDLQALAFNILIGSPSIANSQMDQPKLWAYTCEIAARYHRRPFHSFRHAVDVLLAVSVLLRYIEADKPGELSDPMLSRSLLVAAMVHDVDHPGVMNNFLIATKHYLATSRGEGDAPKAVLETHHANTAIALLGRPELDFLCTSPPEERTRFVELVRDHVLNTDVTTTMPKAKEFGAVWGRRASLTVTDFNASIAEKKSPLASQVACLVIKAADISNPARPLHVYNKWIDGVMTEFFAQGDTERQMGMPISMNCDRYAVVVPKCQVGFISFLVAPLYQALVQYAPGLQPICDQLDHNLAHFKAEAAAIDAAKAKEEDMKA